MSLALALALLLAAPPASPFDAWLAKARSEGRVLDPLATLPGSATYLDRTGGCPRGWVRLEAPTPAAALTMSEHLGAPCDARPAPLNHLMRMLTAQRLGDHRGLAAFVPAGSQLSVATEQGDERTRRTVDHEQVLAGAAALPVCDPTTDTPSCEPPVPDPVTHTDKLSCRCIGPAHTITYTMRALSPQVAPQDVQLVSVHERR